MARHSTQQNVDLTVVSGASHTLTAPGGDLWRPEFTGANPHQVVRARLADSTCFAVSESSTLNPFAQSLAVKMEAQVTVSPGVLLADPHTSLAEAGQAYGYFADRHETRLEVVLPDDRMATLYTKQLDPTPAAGFSTISYQVADSIGGSGGSFTCLNIEHNEDRSAAVQVPDFELTATWDGDVALFRREYARVGQDVKPYDQSRPGLGLLSDAYAQFAPGEPLPVAAAFEAAFDPRQAQISPPATVTVSDQNYIAQALWGLKWVEHPALPPDSWLTTLRVTHTTRYVCVATTDLRTFRLGHRKPMFGTWTQSCTTVWEGTFSPRQLVMDTWHKVKDQGTAAAAGAGADSTDKGTADDKDTDDAG